MAARLARLGTLIVGGLYLAGWLQFGACGAAETGSRGATGPPTAGLPPAVTSSGASPNTSSFTQVNPTGAQRSTLDGGLPLAPDAAPAEPTLSQRFAGTSFPPSDFAPPHSRSARAGDGKWVRLGDPRTNDRAASGRAVLYHTELHPHPVSRFKSVAVVAIDLLHSSVHFAAGKRDPGVTGLPAEYPPGFVPEAHRDSLLAVFNGGFKPKHGRWGMMLAGQQLIAPREQGCTLALYKNGTARLRSWPVLAASQAAMEAYRQTPPCLLEQGELPPTLKAGNERPWGGRDPKRQTRRRSAVGIDASGRVLFYGMGTEVGPQLLAEGMKTAGAVSAAQLDINWSWTRFLLFGQPKTDTRLQVTSTLIPKMVHGRFGYVTKSAARDFFYIMRR